MDDLDNVPAHRRREDPPVPAVTTYTPGAEAPAAGREPGSPVPARAPANPAEEN